MVGSLFWALVRDPALGQRRQRAVLLAVLGEELARPERLRLLQMSNFGNLGLTLRWIQIPGNLQRISRIVGEKSHSQVFEETHGNYGRERNVDSVH